MEIPREILENAEHRANKTGRSVFIADMDMGDGEREILILKESEIDSDEFQAFDGKILEEIEPGQDLSEPKY